MLVLPRFKFKSARKNKFNFIKDENDILSGEIIKNTYSEIFSNKKIIIDGCKSIVDYKEDYLKLKLNKGFMNILGSSFKILSFQSERIEICGTILNIEFCV